MNRPAKNPSTNAAASETPLRAMPFAYECIEETFDSARDLVCFSHLRWDFVYQRPQHLMSRFAREGRVFFVEEPIFLPDINPSVTTRVHRSGVCIVVPQLPLGASAELVQSWQKRLVDQLFVECRIHDCILWYYTPMARAFTSQLHSSAIVYDCMDELSLFKDAPPGLREHEADLMRHADVVFTGGYSLYEAKKQFHHNVHAEPSSIDVDHFRTARSITEDPEDQAPIPRPRLGFAGVIDERMDISLVSAVAEANPDWHLILVGPVVKIDRSDLPQRPNLHYLDRKEYADLPAYMAGWDVAIMPFALNDATRYISPTKTPEYLAAGKPVVSTPILDVVATYESRQLVRIAGDPQSFSKAIREALRDVATERHAAPWLQRVDSFLATTSWDRTWNSMRRAVDRAIRHREVVRHVNAS